MDLSTCVNKKTDIFNPVPTTCEVKTSVPHSRNSVTSQLPSASNLKKLVKYLLGKTQTAVFAEPLELHAYSADLEYYSSVSRVKSVKPPIDFTKIAIQSRDDSCLRLRRGETTPLKAAVRCNKGGQLSS